MYDFKGKVALITGAARQRGIGRQTALRLAKDGADIVVVGKERNPDTFPAWEKREGWKGLESVVEEVGAMGRQALAVTCDVSVKKEVDQAVAKAINKLGHIDILVNGAALHGPRGDNIPLLEMLLNVWDSYLAVNLNGTLYMSLAVAKHMKKRGQGGKIINISSAKFPGKDNAPYSVSKQAITRLSQDMALEWAPYNINVNVIFPSVMAMSADGRGRIILEMVAKEGITEEEAIARHYQPQADRTPLGRVGQPSEAAALIAFLASKEADYITGECISVNGGSGIV